MPTFLDLPREIRDEIYLSILLFNVPPDHEIKSSPWGAQGRPCLNVSILRVNHQIHEEASQILYGRNIFPLRVCVEGSGFRDSKPHHWSSVSYETVWESVGYICQLEGRGRDDIDAVPERHKLWFQRITDGRFNLPPAQRYRHLLRRFSISIRDYRSSQWVDEIPAPGDPERRNRRILKSMLVPIEHRLASLIAYENQTINLDITIHRCVHKENFSFVAVYGPQALNQGYFHQLAYIVWPLTTGHRTYSLKMAEQYDGMGCRFNAIKEEALEQCALEPGLDGQGEGGFLVSYANRDTAGTLRSSTGVSTKQKLVLGATWYLGPFESL
ncbi:hypothetical protein TWF225_000259 [Orbilia oligospora]|nr:hypothetical protein TWF751_004292 [Orbilia oligospora]KAF3195894.1 hypothetical protein TWF225_000259 [Orbilia oligospora]KAF3266473.1 hypothetical protein TWF128_010872 [Orbilia oligospora]KAF3272195.1 hypothetical protein TWF217_003998 [Orbilia oligospora]KAF3297636.1 hypothetical protein TWF132_006049 [Orbilia oligospora]